MAYRALDAQYWPRTPQQRKRIYLVADFAGSSAPQILFERSGLSGDFAEIRQAWEKDHPHPEIRLGEASRNNGGGQFGAAYSLLIRGGCDGGGKGALVQTEKSATLSTHNIQALFDPAGPLALDNHPQDSRIAIREDGVAPTLTEKMGTGGNNVPLVAELIPVNDRATLTAADRHGVAYGISRSFMNQGENAQFDPGIIEETASTLTASHCPPGVATPLTVPEISGTLTAKMAKGTGGPAGDEMQNLVAEWPEYIIRRFTPMECCRLQGFPDWWAEQLGVEEPPAGMVDRWVEIFKTHWEAIKAADGIKTPKTRSQVIKWLKDPASDSALYKMWGNGIALPCAAFVMEGIAIQNRKEGVTANE